ncbi:MAG: ATP synthase F1 subunit epsilon [Candidatus Saccharibacteria bacterium]
MLKLRIVTPERILLETDAASATLPTKLGQITVLPGHIPLVANLVPGEIRYKAAGAGEDEQFFAVSGGFIEIRPGNEVVVLADTAEFGHEIDIERAEQARERARLLMSESVKDEESFADAVAIMEKSLARLKVARKHRTHTKSNLESGNLSE